MNTTVLVTGGSGYLGSWVVKILLEKGYTVRIAVRNKSRKDKVQHLLDMDPSGEKIELWEADLLKPGSFDQAAEGCEVIYHLASPFKLQIKDAQKDLVDPALKGTENVLSAASKSTTVKRVILTSSVVAIYGDAVDMQNQGLQEFTEEQFNTTSSVSHQPYPYSKVMAEKKAWEIAQAQDQWTLAVINPAFIMGPSLSKASDSESIKFMSDLIGGKLATGAPDLNFGVVDVRDVAMAHVLAGENTAAEGRHILSAESLNVLDMANIIKEKYGKKFKLPSSKAPKFILYLMGWLFGITIKFVKNNVGYPLRFNNSKSIEKLGVQYRPVKETILDMVAAMS